MLNILNDLLSSSANITRRPVNKCSFLSRSHPYSSKTSLISFSSLRAEEKMLVHIRWNDNKTIANK